MKIDERLKRCCGRYFAPSIKCEEGSRCADCFDKLEGLREIERLRQNTMLSESIEKEAADEIERLREALSAIALSHNNTVPPEGLNAEMMWIGCVQIARSALQQKDN